MRLSIQITILFIALLLIIAGCGVHKTTKTASSKIVSRVTYKKIDFPDKITSENINRFEAIVHTMAAKHPKRRDFRDKLISYHVEQFNKLVPVAGSDFDQQIDDERRLKFIKCLMLHDPSDFRQGFVSEVMISMTKQIAHRYEKLGGEAIVLAAFKFLMLAEGENKEYLQQYRELSEWSESVRATITDDVERYGSLGSLYMQVIKLVPDKDVVDHLGDILIKRHVAVMTMIDSIERAGVGFPPFLLRAVLSEGGMGRDLIHAYFISGDVLGALDKLKEKKAKKLIGEEYLELLENLEEGYELGDQYYALAGVFGSLDPLSGVRACMLAQIHDPQQPRYPICIGTGLDKLGRSEVAIDYFAQVAKLYPTDTIMIQTIEHIKNALFNVHLSENKTETQLGIKVAAKVVDKAIATDDPEDDILLSASLLMDIIGEIDYNDGRIASAKSHFKKALKIWPPSSTSVLMLAEIEYLHGNNEEAIKILNKFLDPELLRKNSFADYWKAKVLEMRGDCYEAKGRDVRAAKDYVDALNLWKTASYPKAQAAQVAVNRGIINHKIGDIESSMKDFRRAVNIDPDRKSTYAELLSFLIGKGRLDDAKEFYLIAFNQDQIDDMWKIYFSLWIECLAKKEGGNSFDLAAGYLEQSNGKTWQDELARFYTDKIDSIELRKLAKTKGQMVEADFYEAVRLMEKVKKEETKNNEKVKLLLNKVIQSDLMGFFEYKLAKQILTWK